MSATDPAIRYQELMAHLFLSRVRGDEDLEDEILAEMDHVWSEMAPASRALMDALSARIASGEIDEDTFMTAVLYEGMRLGVATSTPTAEDSSPALC